MNKCKKKRSNVFLPNCAETDEKIIIIANMEKMSFKLFFSQFKGKSLTLARTIIASLDCCSYDSWAYLSLTMYDAKNVIVCVCVRVLQKMTGQYFGYSFQYQTIDRHRVGKATKKNFSLEEYAASKKCGIFF